MGLVFIKQIIEDKYHQNPVFTLLVGILFISFIIDLGLCIVTGMDFFIQNLDEDQNGAFMDHFNSMMYSMDHAYDEWKVVYPSLITAFYGILGNWCLPYTTITGRGLGFDFRDTQIGMMILVAVIILTIYALKIFTRKVCEKTLSSQQISFLFFLVLVSTPMLYAIERGNSILICVAAVALFLLGYQSENKWIRYLSYVALGISVGTKITTVFFGFLVIKRRNWTDLAIALIIVAALFLLPFLYTGGSPDLLLSNILHHTTDDTERTLRTFLTYMIWLDVILPSSVVSLLTNVVTFATIALVGITVIFDKKMDFWMQLFIICGLVTVAIGLGIRYYYLIMLLPMAFFLASEKELTRRNAVFTVIFILMFVFAPSMEFTRSLPTIIGMAWILGASIKRLYREYSAKHRPADSEIS